MSHCIFFYSPTVIIDYNNDNCQTHFLGSNQRASRSLQRLPGNWSQTMVWHVTPVIHQSAIFTFRFLQPFLPLPGLCANQPAAGCCPTFRIRNWERCQSLLTTPGKSFSLLFHRNIRVPLMSDTRVRRIYEVILNASPPAIRNPPVSRKRMFDITSRSYTIDSWGGSFYILPSVSILTTPFAFGDRSCYFPECVSSAVAPLYFYFFLCALSPVSAVCLKTEFDILMAFGVSLIVSSECVGCNSNELARTLLQLLHWTAPRLPLTSAVLGKCLQCSLITCHPSHMLQVIFQVIMSYEVHIWQTLWSLFFF